MYSASRELFFAERSIFKTTERSDSNIRQSTFDIRHSLKFHTSMASGQKTAGLIRKETLKKRITNNEYRMSK